MKNNVLILLSTIGYIIICCLLVFFDVESEAQDIELPCNNEIVIKKGWGETLEQNWRINKAFRWSGCDKEMVCEFDNEADWTLTRKEIKPHWCPYTNSWAYGYGVCQISECYHPDIVYHPEFFINEEFQLLKCIELWKSGTAFYAPRSCKNISFRVL